MRRKRWPELTTDEIVATLKRSSLNNVVIEGRDDMVVYRPIENIAGLGLTSLIAAGGRRNVLEIYRRRAELPKSCRVVFVADRDTWIMGGIPLAYIDSALIWTDGYSIENDVIRDSNLISFMTPQESTRFKTELATFCNWYAVTVRRHLTTKCEKISLDPNIVINDHVIRGAMSALLPHEKFPASVHAQITSNFMRVVRGKSLMSLMMRQLGQSGRTPRHNDLAVMEGVAQRPGLLVSAIFNAIINSLEEQKGVGQNL